MIVALLEPRIACGGRARSGTYENFVNLRVRGTGKVKHRAFCLREEELREWNSGSSFSPVASAVTTPMAAKVPKVWICSSCSTKNAGAERVCQGCDNDRSRVRFPRKLVASRDQERELWALYDKDRDGFLAPHEFEQLYALLRKPYFGDALAVFKAIDANKDGYIVRWLKSVPRAEPI